MNFSDKQKQYLILLVRADLEALDELRADDPKRWSDDYKNARKTLVILCGGAK